MRIKSLSKKLFSVLVAAVMAVTLTGCFDLGEFNDEEEYYDSFGEIRLVYQNPESVEKDVEESKYGVRDYFYNKKTGEEFGYGDPEDDEPDEGKDIPRLNYVYMAIPVKRSFNMESFALYFNAVQTGNLKITVFLVNSLPDFDNIRLLNDPEYQQKLDGDGNPVTDEDGNPVYEAVKYSDPSDDKRVCVTTLHTDSDRWEAIVVSRWNGNSVLSVSAGQYLLLRFDNNSGYNSGEEPAIAFRMTNMLVRAVS